jgi:hypothetical protein
LFCYPLTFALGYTDADATSYRTNETSRSPAAADKFTRTMKEKHNSEENDLFWLKIQISIFFSRFEIGKSELF